MLEKFINVDLIRSPVNWAIVFLMCALAASLLAFVVPSQNDAD